MLLCYFVAFFVSSSFSFFFLFFCKTKKATTKRSCPTPSRASRKEPLPRQEITARPRATCRAYRSPTLLKLEPTEASNEQQPVPSNQEPPWSLRARTQPQRPPSIASATTPVLLALAAAPRPSPRELSVLLPPTRPHATLRAKSSVPPALPPKRALAKRTAVAVLSLRRMATLARKLSRLLALP